MTFYYIEYCLSRYSSKDFLLITLRLPIHITKGQSSDSDISYILYPINTRILCAAMFAFPRYRQCLLFDVCKVASTIRARFAQVTQNPLCVFSLLGNLDGDSASPFPRFLTQQAVFFGFYIEYSRSVMVPITRKDKTWQDQKSKRN